MIAPLALLLAAAVTSSAAPAPSPLLKRGYAVLPVPQRAQLGPSDVAFGPGWRLELDGVPATDVAVETLKQELQQRHRITFSRSGAKALRLVLAPESATVGKAQDRDRGALLSQAYRIDARADRVTIAANAAPGLFYGVVTFLQLLKPRARALLLPEGQIEDWPDLPLRQIYWDDAHHLERLEALEDAIRRAAHYKVNGFVLKLDGHFQYRSAPALVEPYALAPAELQRLTDFARRHHVELIPYVDAPAHVAFILKHPQYAHLRAFADSNYEMCVTNPDSYRLLFGMYQDLLDANRGGRYFYVSTDEPYYVGKADSPQCQEATRARELGGPGRLLAEFLGKVTDHLVARGRTPMFWGEPPLKVEDIAALPRDLVNGEVNGPPFDQAYRARGIRQIIYTVTQGEESLFPLYVPLPEARRLHATKTPAVSRVIEQMEKISFDSARREGDVMGITTAGWADAGLHPETFWLGFAAAAATAWHPGAADAPATMGAFYSTFYGPRVSDMNRIYELMSAQAQFWADSWEPAPSKSRKPIWGNSKEIFKERRPGRDYVLPLPPAPGASLGYGGTWADENERRLGLAADFLRDNDELQRLLRANLRKADRNRYSLEVFLSIAALCRQNLELLRALAHIDERLRAAAAVRARPREGVRLVDQALEAARALPASRDRTLAAVAAVWYRTWHPRVAEANGRKFVHELDDVKDHLPDRTVDMSYLMLRQLLAPLDAWVRKVEEARNEFARTHGLPAICCVGTVQHAQETAHRWGSLGGRRSRPRPRDTHGPLQ